MMENENRKARSFNWEPLRPAGPLRKLRAKAGPLLPRFPEEIV